MPTYRSINIALHSQFDIETVPEYHPPPLPFAPPPDHPAVAPLIDDATSTCSVYIPVLPGSQFWIVYSVSPPVPEGHYFLFKLYIDGDNIVSWSTGKEHAWKGKTMFGLFDAGNGKSVEKRALCFRAPDTEGRVKDGAVEIRVHRASGRKRVDRETRLYEKMGHAKSEGGISLIKAGRAGVELPKRFYKFALIDPVDQPFATFRYYYRTWDQLRDLGLLDYDYYADSEGNEFSIIEPEDNSAINHGSGDDTEPKKPVQRKLEGDFESDEDGISVHDWGTELKVHAPGDSNKRMSTSLGNDIKLTKEFSRRESASANTYIPRGAPSEVSTGSPPSLRRRGRLNTYRLSMPPSIKFDAPQPPSRPLPVPQKSELTSSTAYRPHPAYPVEEWTVRTPSPVRSVRDNITTPPLESRRGLSISGIGLLSIISSTWKRSVSSAQATRKVGVDEGVRSVSY